MPWEAEEYVSEKLRSRLSEKGVGTEKELEEFFSSDYGRRVYDHSERFFIVRFRMELKEPCGHFLIIQ